MKFTTFRRYYLDKYLFKTVFSGNVLDVGGKKNRRRGEFKPPTNKVKSWEYINIDASTNPDYLCSADNIPFDDNYFDIVLLAEIIEHVSNPVKILKELTRVVKRNGVLIASIPFMYPIHADPYDFQRWTPDKINKEFSDAGFNVENIEPMGGLVAVIMDMIHVYTQKPTFLNKVIKKSIIVLILWLLYFDKKVGQKDKITTGFFIYARKV